MLASDAETGEVLWSSDAQTAVLASPISYALDGEQYIAVAVGIGGGLATEAGPVVHAWKVPNLSRVLVYKLGGTASLPPVPKSDRTMPKPAAVTAEMDTVKQGQVVYQRHCSYCHGDNLRTGGVTPDLRWSGQGIHEQWQQIVRDGILQGRGMVSFKQYVSAEEAEAIRQYVLHEANRRYRELNPEQE